MSQAESFVGYSVAVLIVIYLFARLIFRNGLWAVSNPAASRTLPPSENTSIGRGLHGMEPSTVAAFPTVKHHPTRDNSFCAICLEVYGPAEILRILPWCTHVFHIDCIDKWLLQNSTCPICRICLRGSPHSAILLSSPALRLQSSPEMILSPGSSIGSYQFASTEDPTPVHESAAANVQARSSHKWRFSFWRKRGPAEESGTFSDASHFACHNVC